MLWLEILNMEFAKSPYHHIYFSRLPNKKSNRLIGYLYILPYSVLNDFLF